MSSKKIILIIGIVVIIAIAAFLIFSARNGATTDAGGEGSIRNFFPFGNSGEAPADNTGFANTGSDGSTDFQTNNLDEPIPKLRKLSEDPIAGAILFNKGKSTTTIVRFVVKDTGNVYEAYSDSLEKKRLTNTTIPKINRAFWLPSGEGFLVQKTDGGGIIETSYIRLKAITASSSNELALPYEPSISNLPTDIIEIAPSPDSKKIFYYTASGGMKGYTSNPDGANPTLVYGGVISEWIPNWFSQNSILLASKASFNSDSLGLFLNPINKSSSKAFGRIIGGGALPRSDGKYVLVSSGGEEPNLFLITTANEAVKAAGVKTLSEKCAWKTSASLVVVCGVPKSTPSANYPDAWYQGLLNTNDTVVVIDLENNTQSLISDLSAESGENIDIQNMFLSKDGFFALFTNKLDQSLWLLKLE